MKHIFQLLFATNNYVVISQLLLTPASGGRVCMRATYATRQSRTDD